MSEETKGLVGILALVIVAVLLFSGFQNAGNTGTFTKAQLAFNAANSNRSSAIFFNIGQAAHYLTYCTASAFVGTIDLEESFDGLTNWIPIAAATLNQDTACHVLQAGGYYQNVRSTITGYSQGTISAWYSSSSGPIPFTPTGLSSAGAAPPIVCDQSAIADVLTSTTGHVGNGALNQPGNTYVICGMTISFRAATSAGTIILAWAADTTCAGATVGWESWTAAGTPQTFSTSYPLRTSVPGQQVPCVINTSGAELFITISGASVRLP